MYGREEDAVWVGYYKQRIDEGQKRTDAGDKSVVEQEECQAGQDNEYEG